MMDGQKEYNNNNNNDGNGGNIQQKMTTPTKERFVAPYFGPNQSEVIEKAHSPSVMKTIKRRARERANDNEKQ